MAEALAFAADGKVKADVVHYLGWDESTAVVRFNHRRHLLSELAIGDTEHCGVSNSRIELYRLLHLLGKDFLARAVDATRATAEEHQISVGGVLGPIPRHRKSLPIHFPERSSGALGILVVA